MRYLLRRALEGVALLAAVSVLTFLLVELAPGDFFSEMRLDARLSPETVAGLRAQYGMDRPLAVRYGRWLASVARGEWGFSFAYNLPVAPLLAARAGNTLLLTVTAALLAWMLALPLGVWSAARRGGWADRLFTGAAALLLAVPDVLLALGLLMLAVRTGWLPAGGMFSPGASAATAGDVARHMILPVTALVLGALPLLLRHVRAAMLETLDAPFIFAARAHGMGSARLLWRHALPAAANPLVSLAGFSAGGLLSGSLLVEVVMGWPGMGPLLLEAILARDVFVVIGAVVLSTLFLLAGNFLADLLLLALDPRIARGRGEDRA